MSCAYLLKVKCELYCLLESTAIFALPSKSRIYARCPTLLKAINMKVKQSSTGTAPPLETFQHTHIAVYLCGFSAVGCICYDSIQVNPSTFLTSMLSGSPLRVAALGTLLD